MKLGKEKEKEMSVSGIDIRQRLANLIEKSENADKYELLRNGLKIVSSVIVGIGLPSAVMATGSLMALPFVDEVRQLKLENMLRPEIIDVFQAMAGVIVANVAARKVNKHVEKQSNEIESEYKALKTESAIFNNMQNGQPLEKSAIELRNKVIDADILSPVQKREIPLGELREKKKEKKLKFT